MPSNERPVALITMATGYVGPALARTLAGRGYDLVLQGAAGDDSMVGVERSFETQVPVLEALGAAVETVTDVDLRTAEGNRAVVQAALDRFGRLDSACFVTGVIIVGKFLDMSSEHWDQIKRNNLDMVFHALQATLPPMVDAGAGQVVVFTSATGGRPDPMTSIYGGTRAGANGIVRAVGLEHARDGVQVNAVGTNFMDFPGFIKASGADDPERRKRIESQTPMRRLGTMDELANVTAVLLDGTNRFQTGQFFDFSGGWGA
ncbi:SDR family NAD(P)-dependent oxidoreductase [Ilumatobacter nonamiensis]|uniref:SDR family NAD(P)-dependent oxidoreductase n=1 Tax=Ilumatobacter nonamiensis TaxID=467093 RepID=UPI000345D627|nr:SDR family oxidoreductase [Ilumatobacter nonamiensis]